MATSVTITTNTGSSNYTLSTGARGPQGLAGSDAAVTAANVAAVLPAAIAEDPPAVREAMQSDFVAVAPATGVPATDLAALNAALSAANASNKQVRLLAGQAYTISDPWIITGTKLTIIFEKGASITQSAAAENAIELDTTSPPGYLTILNPSLIGTGYATSTGAGIYGRKGDNSYLCGDTTILGGSITGFQEGVHFRNVVKFSTERLDISNCVTGYYLDKVDTYRIANARVVGSAAAGDIPNSRCFYFADQTFGGKVVMGEFGGDHIARFCEIDGTGVEAVFEGCNLEAFTSSQVNTIAATGNSTFIFRHGRCTPQAGAAATDAFISCSATGALQHAIEITGLSDWIPTSHRIIEYIGATGGPIIYGTRVRVDYVPSVGGVATLSHYAEPLQRDWPVAIGSLPVSSWVRGETIRFCTSTTGGDEWLQQPLIKLYNNRAAASQRFTMVNEFHEQILAGCQKGSSDAGTKVILTAVLPKTMLVGTGEAFDLRIVGTTAANANDKQLRIKLNGTILFDTGVFNTSGGKWRMEFTCASSGSFEEWDAQFTINDATVGVGGLILGDGDTSGPAWYGNSTTAGTFTVEAVTPTAAADIVYKNGKARWSRGVPALNP